MDYPTLRVIWWLLMGILLIGFMIYDGFDLGSVALMPWVGRTDIERRVIINAVGPVWEGNQVWFVLGGGVFFAAWPYLYSTAFSGFYFAMLLVLLTFIMRPVGFKYRSKLPHTLWRSTWDRILSTAAIVVSLLFGVAVGNVLMGVPFHFDPSLRVFYTGSFWALLRGFPVLCGILSLCLFLMHGAAYLLVKTEGDVWRRARIAAMWAAVGVGVCFAIGGLWVVHLPGYQLASMIDPAGPSNPLHKTVVLQMGAWLHNYTVHPLWRFVPALGFFGALGVVVSAWLKGEKWVFMLSALSITGVISTVGVSMFPFIMPSSSHPSMSLMVWDASASQHSLTLMLWATLIFLPIVLAYTSWVYRVMRGKVTADEVERHSGTLY